MVLLMLWPECCCAGREPGSAVTMEGPHPLAQCPSLRLHQVSEVTESHRVYGHMVSPGHLTRVQEKLIIRDQRVVAAIDN